MAIDKKNEKIKSPIRYSIRLRFYRGNEKTGYKYINLHN